MGTALRNFLLTVFISGALISVSCGVAGGGDADADRCDLTSQRNAQRAFKREDYYPKVFSRDFSRDYDANISPTEKDYEIAKKVSRSVFEIDVSPSGSGNNGGVVSGYFGTAWLIAPGYVATAAHNLVDPDTGKPFINPKVFISTFDGEVIEAEEIAYADPRAEEGTDLAVLRLKRKIDAVPLKIADERPGRNQFLMAIGHGGILSGLGGWTVTAGPALELQNALSPIPAHLGRVYHAVPTATGMSGGPIFNREGEVVSIVSADRLGLRASALQRWFGINPFQVRTSPPDNLWVYGFIQRGPGDLSYGPNPDELRELYNKVQGLEEPQNAGEYRDSNTWERTANEFGDEYSPFPINRFDDMDRVYKTAREGAVTIEIKRKVPDGVEFSGGSGFIYDDDTVVTAGHVVQNIGKGDPVMIRTIDDKIYTGTLSKAQYDFRIGECDIAIVKMDNPNALSEYKKLSIRDSSSLQCGDPLVGIGSAGAYNSVGRLQGVGVTYRLNKDYTSEYISQSSDVGMSGGPVVNINGEVVSLLSTSFGFGERKLEPGLLIIRTRIPVYVKQDFSEGPNAETIRRFIEEDDFYCR